MICPYCYNTDLVLLPRESFAGAFLLRAPLQCTSCKSVVYRPSSLALCILVGTGALLLMGLAFWENVVQPVKKLTSGRFTLTTGIDVVIGVGATIGAALVVIVSYRTWRYSRWYRNAVSQ